MSTKIEYDDAVSTIGTLPMVEPLPNIYDLIELEEIINTQPLNPLFLDVLECL